MEMEANVVIVVEHSDGAVTVYPFWESTMDAAAIRAMGIRLAWETCERLGGGSASFTVETGK